MINLQVNKSIEKQKVYNYGHRAFFIYYVSYFPKGKAQVFVIYKKIAIIAQLWSGTY